jgi:aldose 1-epimerase
MNSSAVRLAMTAGQRVWINELMNAAKVNRCGGLKMIGLALVAGMVGFNTPVGFAADETTAAPPTIEKSVFGKMPDGTEVELYTLRNSRGVECKIMTLGCIITELSVPDRNGKFADVVLGYDNLASYLKGHPLFGAIVGRVVNRIARAEFTLDGTTYQLAHNNGPNHIHGGNRGFDKVVWQATPSRSARQVTLRLTYTSPDGEEGYPGTLKAVVDYTLTDDNELILSYAASSDKATPINMSNHTYFNLAGGGNVAGHLLTLFADEYTPTDSALIPTGEIKPVKGTPVGFTTATAIGARLAELTNPPAHIYDHNFVIRPNPPSYSALIKRAAHVYEPVSGRVLDVSTTQPGVQLYTGYRGKLKNPNGGEFEGALCLETQYFPDFVHHPNFPQSILRPGETYRQSTTWRFSTQ